MEKITYGVPGLVDWIAEIKAGAATLRVHFSGGALTTYGVTPAEYTTANPFIQKVLEQSSEFKNGRIITLRRTEIPNSNKLVKPAKRKLQAATQSPTLQPDAEQPTPDAASSQPATEHEAEAANEEPTDNFETTAATDGFTAVEVSCLQDAHAYLQEKFNLASYKVRSYEAAQRAAAEHGVRFTGAKFDTLNSNDEPNNEEMTDSEE